MNFFRLEIFIRSIHISMHLLPLVHLRVTVELEFIPTVIEREPGYTLGWSPGQRIHTWSPTVNLESLIKLTLTCERKLECPERTHAHLGRTCRFCTERLQPGFKPRLSSVRRQR